MSSPISQALSVPHRAHSEEEKDFEKNFDIAVDDSSSEQVAVGLHEFAVAKESRLRVSREQSRR